MNIVKVRLHYTSLSCIKQLFVFLIVVKKMRFDIGLGDILHRFRNRCWCRQYRKSKIFYISSSTYV